MTCQRVTAIGLLKVRSLAPHANAIVTLTGWKTLEFELEG